MNNSKCNSPKKGIFQYLWSLLWQIFWRSTVLFGYWTGIYNALWKPAYIFLGFVYKKQGFPLRYMNYGYAPLNEEDEKLLEVAENALETENPADKNQIRLYEKLLSLCPLYPDFSRKDMLEIGAGHGGGLMWLCKAHPEFDSVKGMDLTVVDTLDGKIFQGDAHKIPMGSNSVDLVINVETSHCYNDQSKYIAEAMRILRPGGYHLWTDFRSIGPIGPFGFAYNMDLFMKQSEDTGFELIQEIDITPNVIESMNELQNRIRKVYESKWYTRFFSMLWQNFYGMPGSAIHKEFVEGRWTYRAVCWKKPET